MPRKSTATSTSTTEDHVHAELEKKVTALEKEVAALKKELAKAKSSKGSDPRVDKLWEIIKNSHHGSSL